MSVAARLQVQYSTQDAFRAEYASNVSRGGIFIATDDGFEVRDMVEVELALIFCDEVHVLEGEVVHCITADMAAAGGTPGVAIQFSMSVRELQDRLADHVGADASSDERVTKTGRRAAPRSRARVMAKVEDAKGDVLEAQTRDVSASGLQLEVRGEPLPVGEAIELTLEHPGTGEQMPVEGRVVRHVKSSRGDVVGLGVQLMHGDARRTEVASFLNDVQATEHSRRLGAINGPIGDLGIGDLIQMFAASVPKGTLIVFADGTEGSIGFESSQLLWAEMDGLHGQPALETMLALRVGHFELQTRLIEPLSGADDPISLESAVLEAMVALDEQAHDESVESEVRAMRSTPDASSSSSGRIPPSTTFDVDTDAFAECRAELDQTELAVVELAQVGMTVEKLVEVIPEEEIGVLIAIDALMARGVLEVG